MDRVRSSRARSPRLVASALAAPACTVGPNYERPQMPTPAAVPVRRWARAGAVARRRAVVRRCSTTRAAGAHPRSPRQQPRPASWPWRASRRRAPAPASPSRSSIRRSTARRQLQRPAGLERADGATDADDDTTHQNGNYGFQPVVGDRPVRPPAAPEAKRRSRSLLASEQARRGVLVTLVGDVASNYFLLRELDLQLRSPADTLGLNDETVTYFQDRLDGGVSNRLELDRIQAQPRADGGRRSRTSSSRSPWSRTGSRCCSAGRPAPIARTGSPIARAAAAADSGRPARVAPRAPARRRAGGAVARRGQRRHRRGQGAVLPDDQPDGLPRRRQRRPHVVPGRRRRGVVGRRRAVAADLPGRTHSAGTSR